MVRRALSVMVLLLLAASTGWAGIYYEQEMQMPAQGPMPAGVSKAVCYVSGPKLRMEVTTQGMTNIVIQRFDTGMSYTLIPTEKMCMEARMPKLDAQREAQTKVTVTKTGETKKIGTYTCTRYDVTMNGATSQYWMSTEVDLGKEMSDFWQPIARSRSGKLAAELSKLPGFPIRIEEPSPSGATVITFTTIKKQDAADSMFEVPAGYQRMSIPTGAGGF